MSQHTPGPWTQEYLAIDAPLTRGLAVVRNRADAERIRALLATIEGKE